MSGSDSCAASRMRDRSAGDGGVGSLRRPFGGEAFAAGLVPIHSHRTACCNAERATVWNLRTVVAASGFRPSDPARSAPYSASRSEAGGLRPSCGRTPASAPTR